MAREKSIAEARSTVETAAPIEAGAALTLAIAEAAPSAVQLEALTRDPELACRAAGVNKATAAEYAAAMKAGASFPPVVVFLDAKGVHWLADGFHRCAAAELAGHLEIAADVRQGSRREALLHAASANASHGLRRTNADKRRAVLLVAGSFGKWSDRKIAEACGVDNKTVAAVRRAAAASEELPHGEPSGAGAASPDLDAIVAKLARALDRIVSQWPAERRGDLVARLQAAGE